MKENTGAVHVQVPVDVATFLLNEKRPDIQAIELRHKVTILLIPNVHLETPAHTITRLRHDDLNNDDLREPSYKMVDVPIEEAIKQATQQEAAKPRQEAMVKSISPEQPAPLFAEKAVEAPVQAPAKPEGGLFSKIAAWFRSAPQPVEVAPAPEPAKKPREGRGEGRRERGERDGRRGGRNANRRDEERGERSSEPSERKERGNRNERSSEKPPRDEASAATGERKERRPRGERKERGERPQAEVAESKLAANAIAAVNAPLNTPEAPESGNSEEQGARRRGRRGGRGRSERRPEAEGTSVLPLTQESMPAEGDVTEPLVNQEPVVVVIPAAETVTSVEVVTPAVEAIAAPEPAPLVVEFVAPTPVEIAPVVEPVVAEVVAPAVSTPAPAPVVVESADLDKTLAESGLVLVQTTAPAVIAQPEAPAKLGRPRKQKPLAEQGEEAPLVMVETGK